MQRLQNGGTRNRDTPIMFATRIGFAKAASAAKVFFPVLKRAVGIKKHRS
jgi:hypothetical protein